MLEQVDLDGKISKQDYKPRVNRLRNYLFFSQRDAHKGDLPILVIFEGWDAAGKGSIIESLVKTFDPRFVRIEPILTISEEERYRPFMWSYWLKSPAKGELLIYDESYYRRILDQRIADKMDELNYERRIREIIQFERHLSDAGTVIVKLWLHMSKKEQKSRLKKIEKDKYQSWKVNKKVWKRHKKYDLYLNEMEFLFQRSSSHFAPWYIIPCEDMRLGKILVMEKIFEILHSSLNEKGVTRTDVDRFYDELSTANNETQDAGKE